VGQAGPAGRTTPRRTCAATYRDGGKVKNETVANLSALPGHVIRPDRRRPQRPAARPAAAAVTITGSLPHGHAAAVHAMAAKLGLPALLARPARTGT